jgi:hypothetical protein
LIREGQDLEKSADAHDCSSGQILSDPLQVPLVEWNQVIQAFSPNRSDEPLAERVRFRSPNRWSSAAYTEVFECEVERRRIDRISIMEDKPIRVWLC